MIFPSKFIRFDETEILKIIAVTFGAFVAGTTIILAIMNPRNYAKTSENADDASLLTRRCDVPKREFTGNDE